MSRRCPSCRRPVDPTVRWCAGCGASLLAGPDLPKHGARDEPDHASSWAVRLLVPAVAVVAAVTGAVFLSRPATAPTEPGPPPPADALEDLRWEAEVGGLADRPVADDVVATRGVAVVVTEESVWAFAASDGTPLWGRRDVSGELVPVEGAPDYVIVTRPSDDGVGSELVALDVDDGRVRWERTVAAGHAVVTPLAVVVASDGLVALDARDGEVLWRRTVGGEVAAADRERVYVVDGPSATLRTLAVVEGTELWSTSLGRTAVDTSGVVAPAGRHVVVGGADGSLALHEAESGAVVWSFPGARRGDLLDVRDGVVVTLGRDRTFVGRQLTTGAPLWRTDWLVPEPSITTTGDRVVVSSGGFRIGALGLVDGERVWEGRFGPFRGLAADASRVVLADALGQVTGVAASTGRVSWRVHLPSEDAPGVAAGDGVVVTTSRAGEVVVRDADGTVRWRMRTVAAVPALARRLVVLRHAGSTAVPSLTALDSRDGTVRWQEAALEGDVLGRPPLRIGDLVVEASGDAARARRLTDGGLSWERQLPSPASAAATADEGSGIVIVPGRDGRLVALDASSGEVTWQTDLGSPAAVPAAVGDGLVVVATRSGTIVAVSAEDGRVVWTADSPSPPAQSPAVGSGVVAVAGRALVGLDATTGAVIWQHPLPALPAGPPLAASGVFYLATTDGVLRTVASADGHGVGYLLLDEATALGPIRGDDEHYVVGVDGHLQAIGTRPPPPRRSEVPRIERR